MRINIFYVVNNDNTDMRIVVTAPPNPANHALTISIRYMVCPILQLFINSYRYINYVHMCAAAKTAAEQYYCVQYFCFSIFYSNTDRSLPQITILSHKS
jgi:hypothetical protein